MIIGIDGNEANVEKRVGIGEYAFELLRHFKRPEVRGRKLEILIYLKSNPLSHMPEESEGFSYRVFGPGKLWTQWRLPLDLLFQAPRPDVFFSPSHYAPRFSPVPCVISVMDLSYIYFPELFAKNDLYQLRNWTSYSVRRAKKIITISNSSKNDIIKEYRVGSDKVVSVYPGIKDFSVSISKHSNFNMNKLINKYKISKNYILFVGTLQPRKNIVRLIEAFAILVKGSDKLVSDDLELVIVGKKGWLYEEILDAPGKFEVESRVKFLDKVDDKELGEFYKSARCFVLPSLYEGFGLPVLEAMLHSCPVIVSNVSSLPEAGGDACLYVDPEDPSDIAQKIKKLLIDEKLRKLLIERGRKQVKKFSWEKTARETLKVLEEVGLKS
jgi:glycosyltransferase involved in cell wall biosynthesis